MKNQSVVTVLALAVAGLLPGRLALAQSGESKSAPSAAAVSSSPDFRRDFFWQFDMAEKRIIALAEAIPANQYTWRPSAGVRSISEVFLHIAAGNYTALQAFGVQPPPGFELHVFETATTDKTKVLEALRDSFGLVRKVAGEVELGKKVLFFGQSTNAQRILMAVTIHLHEHLGQSIAYARSVGVVPPWSAAEGRNEK